MTTRQKRTFTQLDEGLDPFDQCVRFRLTLFRGTSMKRS